MGSVNVIQCDFTKKVEEQPTNERCDSKAIGSVERPPKGWYYLASAKLWACPGCWKWSRGRGKEIVKKMREQAKEAKEKAEKDNSFKR